MSPTRIAAVMWKTHPDWSVQQMAAAVGCAETSLYKVGATFGVVRPRVSYQALDQEQLRRARILWRNLKRRLARAAEYPEKAPWVQALTDRWNYYGGRCWVCRDEATTWDHVKPLAAGGHPTLPANLRPACHSCNARKWKVWAAA